MKRFTVLILIVCLLTVSQLVCGDVIQIENPGFENPPLADNEATVFVPGWDLYNPNDIPPIGVHGCWNPPVDAYPDEAPEGENIAWVWWCFVEENAILGLSQTLKATLQANTTYTLTVRVGNSLPIEGLPELEGFPGYRIELLAGDTVLVADDNSLLPPEGDFGLSSINYTARPEDANLGTALSIRLINLLELFAQWGTDGPADFDESGAVNTSDLLILFANWGPCK